MVNCDILIKEKRKTLSITIGKNGEVIVKSPIGINDKQINAFIDKKRKWIETHTYRIKNNNKQYSDVISTKKILIFNELYDVVELDIKKSTLQNNTLYIKQSKTIDDRKKQIKKWFLNSAYSILKNRLDYFANIMNLEYNNFKLTNAKTKWGSCSSLKNIDLNWRLIMLKSELQDYVIVHELCHLIEMNHSQRFYNCIESILKDYKNRRKEIKNSSFILQLYR